MMRKTTGVLIAVFALLAVVIPAQAATLETGEIFVLQDDALVDDNLYVGAGNVLISGGVSRDIVAGSSKVLVDGVIGEDVLVAAGTIDIIGDIGGDVRVAGGQITINSSIGGDLLVFGGMVQVGPDAEIGGDVAVFGGDVSIAGDVTGNTRVFGGTVDMSGTVAGNVDVNASQQFSIGPNTQIDGYLIYRAPNEVEIPEGAVIVGDITFSEIPYQQEVDRFLMGVTSVFVIGKILALLLTGILAVLVAKRFSTKVGGEAVPHFGRSLVIGLAALIVTPIAAVLLLATGIGAYIGALVFAAYITALILASIYSGVIFGALLAQLSVKNVIVNWKWAALGIAALSLISLVPFVGWAVAFIFFLASLGSLTYLFTDRLWKNR